jgi:hypothetical protein
MKDLPNIHQNAFKYKNMRKLQHDGGRAWIKNPQIHEAIKGTETVISIAHSDKKED